jgi:rubrerythrin
MVADLRRLDALIDADRHDVVSVLINLKPGATKRGASGPASVAWVRRAIHERLDTVADGEREQGREAADRILERLGRGGLRARGAAFYAGPGLWEEFLLPVSIPNTVRYGAPEVMPLLWAADEYEPYGILAADRESARLFTSYLGRSAVVQKTRFRVNTGAWRRTAGRAPASARRSAGGMAPARGADRETFEDRLDEHRQRFWHEAVDAAVRWLRDRRIERVIVAGPDEATAAVRSLWPEDSPVRIAGVVSLPPAATDKEIRERTLPAAVDEERRHEDALVTNLVEQRQARGGSVGGRSATFAALAGQQVMTVIADRDIGGAVWRCGACGYAAGAPVAVCPICGGAVEEAALRDVLPLLVRRNGAHLELVGGAAAERMRAFEGIGALLRFTDVQKPPDLRERTA